MFNALRYFKMASLGGKRVIGEHLNEEALVNQLLVAKKKKYTTKFKPEWLKNHSSISRSHNGDEFFKCCSCRTDSNVARCGKNDPTKHILSQNHKKNYAAACESQKITSLFRKE